MVHQLDDSDLGIMTEILDKIYDLHPHLEKKIPWEKWFSLMKWVLGWEVFSNSHSIKHIKQN